MEQDKETKKKVVETYAEDVAKVLENDRSGLIKKIIHQEEENEMEKRNLSPESKKNKFLMFASALFFLLGLATFFYFLSMKEETPTISVEQQFVPLVFNDALTSVEVAGFSKEQIIQTVYNAVTATKVKQGGIEGIYLSYNKKFISLREFIALIEANFIPSNNSTLIHDNFLMGVVNNTGKSDLLSTKTGKDFFILLKMRSIPDIFDSLRAWEEKIFFDLHGFWGVNIDSETEYLLTKEFQDGIVENKNARVLYDIDNEVVMMYIFANDNSIVITSTEDAGREVMRRLATSQIKK